MAHVSNGLNDRCIVQDLIATLLGNWIPGQIPLRRSLGIPQKMVVKSKGNTSKMPETIQVSNNLPRVDVLPRKLTCPLKINGWKMYFLLK